jgi:DtxR family Mn-dependent transcriptional regulator
MSQQTKPALQTRPTHTVENYLMMMQVMERDFGGIVAARLAEMLSVAPATVATTLKRMERDNWITGTGRKTIHLTEIGLAAAHSVVRRHMLTEWMLFRILKVPLPETHSEAHGIEHALSPQLEERMRDVLGDPHTCPHGNPFPGREQSVSTWIPLTEISAGEPVIIRRIHEFAEENRELLEYLIKKEIIPGAEVEVVDVLDFNQTMTINVRGKSVTLGFPAARFIFAERRTRGAS